MGASPDGTSIVEAAGERSNAVSGVCFSLVIYSLAARYGHFNNGIKRRNDAFTNWPYIKKT